MHNELDGACLTPPWSGATGERVAGLVADLRRRMGADLAWFGRLGTVPRPDGGAAQWWWSGIWAHGKRGAVTQLAALDEHPVARHQCPDLAPPGHTWRTVVWPDSHATAGFARAVYLRHDLLEEHRLAIVLDGALLGIAAVAWDKRRTGATRRISQGLRAGHALWLREHLAVALPKLTATTCAFVLREDGPLFHEPAFVDWWRPEWHKRLVRLQQRRSRPGPVHLALGGSRVELRPLVGPGGSAWLGQVRPLEPPVAVIAGQFTPAQATVTELLLAGCTAAEIARELGRSAETVRSQIKQVYRQLGVTNRLELARALGHKGP